MINWTRVEGLKNKHSVESKMKELITGVNYGKGVDQWSLSELLQEKTNIARVGLRLLSGKQTDGTPLLGTRIVTKEGLPLRYKLKVLSRQACKISADGEHINQWDTTAIGENEEGEICPSIEDKPCPGDVVMIKGNFLMNDPMTGDRLTKSKRQAMIARKEAELDRTVKPDEATHEWHPYTVGEDLCITVEFDHACQLLSTKGKRIAVPKFKTGGHKAKKGQEPGRKITNYLFEEVFPGQEKPKKRTRSAPKKVEMKEESAPNPMKSEYSLPKEEK